MSENAGRPKVPAGRARVDLCARSPACVFHIIEGAAEVTVTQIPEAAKPTEAVLPATLPETTGENVQGINRVQDLTVGELEEMLKKKKMAERKNQKKADNENPLNEKKPVRNRSASLRRNSENK